MTLPHARERSLESLGCLAILPLPLKTGIGLVIYKCNKYPEEYTMNYKDFLLFITFGIAICLLVTYLLYDVFCDYHMENEDLNFLEENWTDTTKRPYDIHGLDGEKE